MSLSESPLASAAQPKKLERKAYLLFRQLFMLTIKLRQLFNPPDLSDKCLWKMLKIPWPFTQLCAQQPCLGVGYMQDGPKSEMQPSATPHILLPISYQTMWQHTLLSVQYLSEEMHCEPLLREFCHTSVFPLGYRIMPCTELPEHLYGQLMKHKPFQHSIVDDTTA